MGSNNPTQKRKCSCTVSNMSGGSMNPFYILIILDKDNDESPEVYVILYPEKDIIIFILWTRYYLQLIQLLKGKDIYKKNFTRLQVIDSINFP